MSQNELTSHTPLSEDQEKENKFNLLDLLEMCSRNRLTLFLVGITAIVFTVLYHFAFPSYSARSYLFIDSQQESTGLRALLGSMTAGPDQSGFGDVDVENSKYLMTLDSASFFHKFAEDISHDPDFPRMKPLLEKPASPMAFIRDTLLPKRPRVNDRGWLEGAIEPEKLGFKRKGVVEVVFSTVNPELSVFLSNHYLDAAVKMAMEHENKKIEEARSYIQTKIKETVEKLAETDQKIVGVSTKNATRSFLAPQSAIAEYLLKLKEDLQATTFKFQQNEKVIQSLKEKTHPPDEKVILPDSLFGLQRTISSLELENQILRIRMDTLKKGLDEHLKTNLSLPKVELHLADLTRQKGLDFFIFDNLFKTLLQIEVKGLTLLNRVYPLEHVDLDVTYRTMGLVSKLILALFLSLLFAAVIIYVKNLVSPVIRTKEDFEGLDMSYLGSVPKIDPGYFKQLSENSHFIRFQLESKETIAFRHIRSKLVYLSAHSGTTPRKIVSILSYGNGEGKSFLSSNLALCFAHMGKRTLLVDFDLRRAALTKTFQAKAAPGICAYLDQSRALDEVIIRDVQPNLDLLPAGSHSENTIEHFSNQKFLDLMEKLKPKYDFIVIDTAPLLVAHESLAIAQDTDFVVLVATSWKTKREYIKDCMEEIHNVRKARTHFLINKAKNFNENLVSNYYYNLPTRKRLAFGKMDKGEASAISKRPPSPEQTLDN